MVILAVGILVFVFYQFQRGEFLSRSWRWIRREDSPATFWTGIVVQTLMAIALVISQIRAVYNSN